MTGGPIKTLPRSLRILRASNPSPTSSDQLGRGLGGRQSLGSSKIWTSLSQTGFIGDDMSPVICLAINTYKF